jgi:hypothetical protein
MNIRNFFHALLAGWLLCASGCGGESEPGKRDDDVSCEDEGETCACPDDDESKGKYECRDGEQVCECKDSANAEEDAGSKTEVDAAPARGPDGSRPPPSDTRSDGGSNPPSKTDASAPAAPDAGTLPPPPPPFTGMVDGDPAKPMVSVPGLPCGAPMGRATPPTIKIGGRDVVVVYPCAREGAAVTFLFTLHGTLQEAQKFSFTLNAGPFHRLADSHNVIYVLPKAVGTQWGREDMGTDLPHIHEVIDWVYATFGEKFNIRSMWAQGGSWGAAYLSSTLACDPKLEQRLKGVRLIVGGGCPRCSNRLSCIVAQQELEIGGGMAMSPEQREMAADKANINSYAMSKGCQGKMGPMTVGTSKHWVWPGCNKGWVYSYYMGPGQHADPWDAMTIEKTMTEMKSIE